MSLRTKQTMSVAGTPPTFAAVTASDTMPVGDRLFAVYRSTHTVQCDVIVVMPTALTLETGDDYPNKTYSLAIGSVTMQELWIPLLKLYQDGTTGVATITTELQDATITMAVVER
jgi:hypothetical protein